MVRRKSKEIDDTEPQWSPKKVTLTFLASDIQKWYSILRCRYFYCIPKTVDTKWNDVPPISSEHGETHITVKISSESAISFSLFYSTHKIRIQGVSMAFWLEYEYPLLQSVYNMTKNVVEDIHNACSCHGLIAAMLTQRPCGLKQTVSRKLLNPR